MTLVKEHSKLISFASVVALVSILVNFYLYINIKPVDYSIRFHEFVDEKWRQDLHWKILWHFSNWNDNGTFTPTVGHCHAICENDQKTKTNLIHVDDYCKSSPVVIYDSEITEEKLKLMTAAEATVPCTLRLDKSIIPGANRGIFTKYRIPKSTVFGPYTGELLSDYGEEGEKARSGGYSWKIARKTADGEEDNFNIDGVSEHNSNWLRWVNSARWKEEQNMIALLFNYTVYYMTIIDVEPETELLIWYGTNYAKKVLSIYTKLGSGHNWDIDVAPPKDIVVCPTCPATDGPIDEEVPEVAEDHHSEDLIHIDDDEPEDIDELDDEPASENGKENITDAIKS